MSREFVHSDIKKISNIASMYNIPEDTVRLILETYLGLCLYNMILYHVDNNIFGEMRFDKNLNIKLVKESDIMKKISDGKITSEDLLRLINNGREVI